MRSGGSEARRPGFTLVELLVVLAIIAILIAMLLPAVSTVRESVRRTRCASNIRNLGVALNNYHQANRAFPPSMYVPKGTADPTAMAQHQMNWVIAILPFLEFEPVYRLFDLSKPISDPVNRQARGMSVPIMLCPSDVGAETHFAREAEGDNWARGNYGANASIQQLNTSNVGASSYWWSRGWCRGVMGANVGQSIDEITDGQSCTILVGELRIGLSDIDRRGVWAMGAPAASSLWGHASDDGIGPNNCAAQSDNVMGCQELWTSVGSRLTRECMGCCRGCRSSQGTMRSRHPGGVNVCFVDCGVRFISDFVEKASSWSLNLNDFRTWERLNASADRLPVEAAKY